MNLLIVDMLEGFTRQGVLASPRVEALIPKQVEFIRKMPDCSYVLFACDSHMPDDSELRRMPIHCMKGTAEAAICPEIFNAVANERRFRYDIIEKTTHSAFFGTNADEIVALNGTQWVVIGCVTDICIAANVMELDYRGKQVTLVRDLIDTYQITPELAEKLGNPAKAHDPNVINPFFFDYYFPGVFGANVKLAADVLSTIL